MSRRYTVDWARSRCSARQLDRPLTASEIKAGLRKLDDLLAERAPVLRPRLAESADQLRSTLGTSPAALSERSPARARPGADPGK